MTVLAGLRSKKESKTFVQTTGIIRILFLGDTIRPELNLKEGRDCFVTKS